MSVISGTVGAILGSQAQEEAARRNLQAAQETNALNYRMFQEGRGSAGSAFLPAYFGGTEAQLAKDASNYYNQSRALMGSPEEQYAKYAATVGAFQPMADASRGALGDVFNGNLTASRLGYLAPVNQARTDFAKTQQQGVLEGLQQRINALNAQNSKQGFTSTGSFAQNRLLGATVGARQAAAGALAGANLANAQDVRSVNDQGAEMKLNLMNAPYQQAQNALTMQMSPLAQVQQNYSRQLQPFEFFRMAPQGFRADQLPQQPVVPGAGQIAFTGMGAANAQLGQHFANQAQAAQYAKALQNAQYTNDANYIWNNET